MTWTPRLDRFFSRGSISKGESYFRSHRVDIDSASTDYIEATVKGSGWYSVVLDLNAQDEVLAVSCTCPYFDQELCKHIWATILTAESQGQLQAIEALRNPSIKADYEDVEWKLQSPAPVVKLPPAPSWQQQLTSVRPVLPAETFAGSEGKRRIIYLADVTQSISTGGLVIHAVSSRLKKNGEWGKPAFYENHINQVQGLESSDQRILALLLGATDVYSYSSHSLSTPESARARHRLSPAAQDILVPILCETERFFVKSADSDALFLMKWESGPAWSFRVRVDRDETAAEYIIRGVLQREESERPLTEPLLLVDALVFFQDHVARFDHKNMLAWVKMLRKSGELRVPFAQSGALVREMAEFPVLPSIELPEELRVERLPLINPPELQIRSIPGYGRKNESKLACWVTFDYAGVKIPGKLASGSVQDPQSKRYYQRDVDAETAALGRLAFLGFRRVMWEKHQWELPPARLPAAVRTLVAEGWRVEAEGKLYRRAGNVEIRVSSGVDWFELQGSADFEGISVDVPKLLKAVARGENMVRLDDDTYGLVPEDWLKRYRFLAAFGKSDADVLKFERRQAPLLDALLAEQPQVSFDETFNQIRQELATFAGVRSAEESATFTGKLRDYQREGLGWLQFLRRYRFGGCLADDMGLGKTVQVLALLDAAARSQPSLIVVPRSLIFNWMQEAARFTPRLRVLDHTGGERMDNWTDFKNYDIILTTYGTLRRDAPLLKDVQFDTVILDEAQAIKNANTDSAKAVRLLKADYRLALTGTPVENRLSDLWSIFEFLNPGLLGTASVFRSEVSRKNGIEEQGLSNDESVRVLSKALRPFLLRRTKDQVARELPAKTEQTIYCELQAEQRRSYDELRDHYRNALLGRIDSVGIEKSRMQVLEALLRLRQAACHPGLIDKQRTEESSAKLESLIPQITELIDEGHKALVFSQFTSLLDIVRKRLAKEEVPYEYLDGRTRDREARVRRFQEDENCRLFLISLKAGGVGLNLTAAEYVFLLDPWWNPAIEAQAIDRTHRIGQTRNVFAYRLIARDTVEEKILELQRTKRDLADAIISADNAVLAGLTRENLELLLS